MVDSFRSRKAFGFSLVEMMVAVLFTGLLMSGMARVYKSSLSSFQTSAEKISAGRRGRVAVDMIADDLNAAGMLLGDLTVYPSVVSPSNPGFWVNPNVPVALSDGTIKADQIYFYYDEALPFEGRIAPAGAGSIGVVGSNPRTGDGTALTTSNTSWTVDTGNPSFAAMIKKGHAFVSKDGFQVFTVQSDPVVSGSVVVLDTGAAASGISATGSPQQRADGSTTGMSAQPNDNHKVGAAITFMNLAQSVVYSIKPRNVDPADPSHSVPCLVREQGPYTSAGLATVTSTQVLAEDVSKMLVYLSVDGGRTWLREPSATGLAAGWNAGYRAQVESALAGGYGRKGYTTLSDPNWYREIPMLVRVDVTTRTAIKREEYNATATPTLAYKEQTLSLVIRPRHFGLSFN